VLAVERVRLRDGGQLPSNIVVIPELSTHATTDPFDGESLRVRPTPGGYVIYSIGANAQDNGGTAPTKKKRGKPAADDITFFVER
jgi:hypothetical protein